MRRRVRAVCLSLGLLCACADIAAQQPDSADVALRGALVPTGFDGGQYSAMIQVAVDGSPLANVAWDLRASLRSGNGAPRELSGHVVAGEPGTPVVFESLVEFEPGDCALDVVARETTAGQHAARTVEGRWPDPDLERATISPIALLQPAQGAFLRGERSREQGALAVGQGGTLYNSLPTATVSVVCRGPGLRTLVRVERELVGSTAVNFPPIELAPGEDRCAQVRDIIPAGTLGVGGFHYRVRLITDTGPVASRSREFDAVAEVPRRSGP